jgi:4-hydroxy-tetrahydrodipicolinate reductase
MIRVGVLGAAGRMGRMVCRAVADDPDLSLVAAVNPSFAGRPINELIGPTDLDLTVASDLDVLSTAAVEVAVDFTTAQAVMANVRKLIEHGIHAVVGTTGMGPKDLAEIERLADGANSNVIVAPNFAIGAVLMQRFATEAAKVLPAAEIIEMHHQDKPDAPSGTARATAERIAKARVTDTTAPSSETIEGARGADVAGIRVHAIRLPGMVAHQEVIFGGTGEVLTIRHDSLDRVSFMPGVLLAIKAVQDRPGFTFGLEPILGLDA